MKNNLTTTETTEEMLASILATPKKQKRLKSSTFWRKFGVERRSKERIEAWEVYKNFSDKDWSFTDCTSKVIIEKFRITHAFSFDKHFKQIGSIIVVP